MDEFSEVTHLISTPVQYSGRTRTDTMMCQLPPSIPPCRFAFNAFSIASNASILVLGGRWTAREAGEDPIREGHSD